MKTFEVIAKGLYMNVGGIYKEAPIGHRFQAESANMDRCREVHGLDKSVDTPKPLTPPGANDLQEFEVSTPPKQASRKKAADKD